MSIQVADINPLRFIDNANLNKGFDGNYYANQLNWYQTNACFLQTWLKSDILYLQFIANEVPDDLQFLDQYQNVVDTAIWQAKPLTFPDYPDLVVYELTYPFLDLPNGIYEAVSGDWGSEPFEVKDEDETTILIKYKNSRNDFSTVFDTGIEFQIRLHAAIHSYRPQNERNSFVDQKHNNTQLSSVAYRRFTFTIGTRDYGTPYWVIDKYNILSQCDQISYDGIYYQIPEDTEPDVESNEDYAYIWEYNIDIEPVDNNFIRYTTQPDGTGVQTFTPVQKVIAKYNVSGGFNIAGIFKYLSKIESFDIIKTGTDFLLNIGVTPGGGEIVSNWNVDENRNDIEVNYLFTSTETIYFSGAGLNASALIVNYLQLDEPPVPVSPVASPSIAKNAGVFFFEIQPGDLVSAFDLATGLGLTNGNWKDWAIAGTNGTPNMDGKLPIGWDRADVITIGTDKGSATITIGKTNLPAEGIMLLSSSVGTAGGAGNTPTTTDPVARARGVGNEALNYEMVKGTGTANIGKSGNLGDGTPLPFTPLSLVCVYVIKIA